MSVRITLITLLVALALVAIGAGGAVGVMLWEPWDGDGESPGATEQQATPSAATGPTQAEEVMICLEAQQAAADFLAAEEARAARQEEAAQGS